MGGIELRQHGAAVAFAGWVDEIAAAVRKEIRDRGFTARVDNCALMLRGEKGSIPVFGAVGGKTSMVREDDERGQVLIHRS